MQQKRLNLIIGVILAIVTIVFVNMYLVKERERVEQQYQLALQQKNSNLVPVLLAIKRIPKETILKPEMFKTEIIPQEALQPGALTNADSVANKKTLVEIPKGDQVTTAKISFQKPRQPRPERGRSLAETTPSGKRAVTIKVDVLTGAGGMILPGDRVDVVASIAIPMQTPDGKQIAQQANVPLFQHVLVLAVGQQLATTVEKKAKDSSSPWQWSGPRQTSQKTTRKGNNGSLITLALSPQEANLLGFVSEQAKIRLMLRNVMDAKVVPTLTPANWESFFQYVNTLYPKKQPDNGQTPKPKKSKSTKKVEIYRGFEKGYINVVE